MSSVIGTSILETLIGLSFVYFVLSIICSSIQEIISSLIDLRAKDLEYGLAQLLGSADLKTSLYNHPVIKALGMRKDKFNWITAPIKPLLTTVVTRKKADWNWGAWTSGPPSYIPARTFTLALFDIYAPAGAVPQTLASVRDAVLKQAQDTSDKAKAETAQAILALIDAGGGASMLLKNAADVRSKLETALPDSAERKQVLDSIDAAMSLAQVRATISNLPESTATKAVLGWLDDAQKGLDAARSSVEQWFDSSMERVSGVYKRQVQYWLLLIAVVVVLLSGADTVRMWSTFQNNSTLRSYVVAQAGQVTQAQATPTQAAVQAQGATATAGANTQQLAEEQAKLLALSGTLNQLPGVLGYDDLLQKQADGSYQIVWHGWSWVLWKVVGLALTVFAVSMGAPFWFDVLQKVSSLSGAGPAPAKSGEEAKAG